MPKIKFALLKHGFIENDLSWNTSMANPASIHNKAAQAIWSRFPCFSVLIYHSDVGWILYDCGVCPGDEKDRLPEYFKELYPLYATEEDYLENRLKSVGLTPHDISQVIISHTHWDHMGGIGLFSHTKAGEHIITSEADYSYGIAHSHANLSGVDGGYVKKNYQFDGLGFDFVDEDYELADGIKIFSFTGHTPCILGLMVQLQSGTYLFPSDTVNSRLNYGPPARPSAFMYDSLGYMASLKKLRRLEKEYNATIIFPHDYEQFCSLKLAPEFYE